MAFQETRNTNPKNLIPGAKGHWEMVIGMEVHAQVASEAKLFSGAPTAFGGAPNSHVSLVDAAMPGMLPVINEECVRQAVRTGLALWAKEGQDRDPVRRRSVFARKNYFYPDLPQGYQISQYSDPIVGEGAVVIEVPDENDELKEKSIGIERLHLEQDAGKLLHDQHPTMSYVDLNRSGVALMEIVSKPDMRSADEARAFLTKLRSILRYLGTSDADMEKGNLRADVNVSVMPAGSKKLGTRCEIKNVNSIRFAGQAIEYEARRQIAILEDGGTIEQETRLFDPLRGETRSMRSKEEAHDYRYFPDPDLLPLEFNDAYVAALDAALPELPDARRKRFRLEYTMNPHNAGVLTADKDVADFYEAALRLLEDKYETIGKSRVAAQVGFFVTGTMFGVLNRQGILFVDLAVTPLQIATIQRMIFDGEIGATSAKQVLEIMVSEGGDPREIVEKRGLKQVTETGAIEKIVNEVLAANAEKAEQAKAKPTMLGWFVGQVMKESGGKANPQAVNMLLKAKLGLD